MFSLEYEVSRNIEEKRTDQSWKSTADNKCLVLKKAILQWLNHETDARLSSVIHINPVIVNNYCDVPYLFSARFGLYDIYNILPLSPFASAQTLVLLLVDSEVLSHSISSFLVGLVLGEPVDCVGLFPVVLGQDVLGAADLVDDVVLCTVYRTSCGSRRPVRTCWRYILVNAASEVQADKNCFHFPSWRFFHQ